MGYFENPQDTAELLLRVLCDRPQSTPIIYLLGHTDANASSVLQKGAELWRKSHAKVALCGLEDCPPYAGAREWTEKLTELRVHGEYVLPIQQTLDIVPVPCTDTEMISLLRYMRANGMVSVILVTPSFHAMRTMVSAVSAMKRLDIWVRAYMVVGELQDWDIPVQNTQGRPPVTRAEEITSEMAKVERYFAKGDHVSLAEVTDYFRHRHTL